MHQNTGEQGPKEDVVENFCQEIKNFSVNANLETHLKKKTKKKNHISLPVCKIIITCTH